MTAIDEIARRLTDREPVEEVIMAGTDSGRWNLNDVVALCRRRGWTFDENGIVVGMFVRRLKPCGTRAAYVRHRVHRETPCRACKAAERIYQADQKRHQRASRGLVLP